MWDKVLPDEQLVKVIGRGSTWPDILMISKTVTRTKMMLPALIMYWWWGWYWWWKVILMMRMILMLKGDWVRRISGGQLGQLGGLQLVPQLQPRNGDLVFIFVDHLCLFFIFVDHLCNNSYLHLRWSSFLQFEHCRRGWRWWIWRRTFVAAEIWVFTLFLISSRSINLIIAKKQSGLIMKMLQISRSHDKIWNMAVLNVFNWIWISSLTRRHCICAPNYLALLRSTLGSKTRNLTWEQLVKRIHLGAILKSMIWCFWISQIVVIVNFLRRKPKFDSIVHFLENRCYQFHSPLHSNHDYCTGCFFDGL